MRPTLALLPIVIVAFASPLRAQVPEQLLPERPPVEAPEPQPPPAPAGAPRTGPRLTPQQPIPPAELETFVDATIRMAMERANTAGAAVAIVQDGAVVLARGYGFADFDPLRPVDPATTLFRIGSITKTFTWLAILQAMERGQIDLGAPVNDYLPEDLRIPAGGFTQPIRVRDLMTHQPGFEDHAVGILFYDDPARMRPPHEFLNEERPRRVREPGVLSSYSNYGTALAGALAAEVAGVPWQDLIERDILRPLGVSHITVREPYPPREDLPAPIGAELGADFAQGFRFGAGAHRERTFEYITQIAPAGVMSASALAMARYMRLLLGHGTLDGVTIYGPRAAAAIDTPMTSLPQSVGNFSAGFFDFRLPGGFRGFGHSGATLSFFANMSIVPELRLGIFVATNTEGGAQVSDPLPGQVVDYFYGPPPKPPDPPGLTREEASAYAGHYVATRRAYHGLEGMFGRFSALPVTASPEGYLQLPGNDGVRRLVPAAEPETFRLATGTDDGPAVLLFERSGERAERIVMAPIAFERVGLLHHPQTMITAAALGLFAAGATLLVLLARLGTHVPATPWQRAAGAVQVAGALGWVLCAASVAVLAVSVADIANVFYDWPTPSVLIASWAGLAAAVLALIALLLLPPVWRGARFGIDGRPIGWSRWRKARYTLVTLAFAALGALLALWGGLSPWDP